MTGHDGCGCGHAHGATDGKKHAGGHGHGGHDGGHAHDGHSHEAHGHDGHGHEGHAHGAGGQATEMEMAGCGDGCGCAHGEDATNPMETAALRGFLSGIYASRLDAAQLKTYLEQMGADESSEFGRPAQFLHAVYEELVAAGEVDGELPPAFRLLDAVAGDDEDAEGDGSEEE